MHLGHHFGQLEGVFFFLLIGQELTGSLLR